MEQWIDEMMETPSSPKKYNTRSKKNQKKHKKQHQKSNHNLGEGFSIEDLHLHIRQRILSYIYLINFIIIQHYIT